jgi:hypothetical protein
MINKSIGFRLNFCIIFDFRHIWNFINFFYTCIKVFMRPSKFLTFYFIYMRFSYSIKWHLMFHKIDLKNRFCHREC